MTWVLLALVVVGAILLADSIRKDVPHAFVEAPCGRRCCAHCAVCGRAADYLQHQEFGAAGAASS